MGSRNTSFADGTVASILLGPIRLVLVLVVGFGMLLALAWSIDWYFVAKVWPRGVAHFQDLLAADLARGIGLAAMQGAGPGQISGPANVLYGVVFESTGIHAMALRFADAAALSIPDTVVRGVFVAHPEAIETAMLGTQLLGVRFATLLRFLPLLLLVLAVGAADGLAVRAIRSTCGGRESASLYHRAKYLQMVLLALGSAAALLWPGTIAWEQCAAVVVLISGVLARAQWAYYKKHL